MNSKLLVLHIFLLLASIPALSATYKPIISNFTTKDYSIDAGFQNWCVSQGEGGEIYVGNNKGLLIFDGFDWSLQPLPNGTVVRSVLVDGKRIYVGSYEEFGYFERDNYGHLIYTSLSDSISADFSMSTLEVWNIVKNKGSIYFQSFGAFFEYDGSRVAPHKSKLGNPLYFHDIDGELYVQLSSGPVCCLDGSEYVPLFDRAKFDNDHITATIPLKSQSGIHRKRALLCSEVHGLFAMNGRSIKKFPTQIDESLRKARINRAVLTQDSTILLGTILDGIFAIDLRGKLLWHYNHNSGLNNNSVLRLFCDKSNNVWVALDNGIALIRTGAPYSVLAPDRDEPNLGMIYDLSFSGNDILMASNSGLYSYYSRKSSIEFISGSGGQNWHVTSFHPNIYVGNNTSTMMLDNGVLRPLPGTASSSTCMRLCKINGQEIIIESGYAELRVYRKVNGVWGTPQPVKGFAAPIRSFEVDQTGTIWAANMNVGLYRINLNSANDSVRSYRYIKSIADSVQSVDYIMKVRGRVVFSDNLRLYTYDDINDCIIPYSQLNEALYSTRNIHSATAVDDKTFWLSGQLGYTLVEYGKDGFHPVMHIPATLTVMQGNDSNSKAFINGKYAYFNLNNSILRYDIDKLRVGASNIPVMRPAEVKTFDSDDEVRFLPVGDHSPSDASTSGNISFKFNFPTFNTETLTFRFSLKGAMNQEKTVSAPSIVFSNLPYGDYNLLVEAVKYDGKVIASSEYAFSVSRPPLLSIWAFFAYIIIVAVFVYYLSKWQTSRALRRKTKEYEEAKMKADLRMLEQDQLIARQQQQLLEAELTSKGKEMASLAMEVVARRQLVDSVKDEMRERKRKGKISQRDIDLLISQLESDSGSSEFWDIFQQNFDLIHDHFFRNLRERYPSLTHGDLKFCALLRMNLSTKDIARFTNLSIRGVEAARYRLRKKFNLAEKQSLVDFLIELK